MTKRDTFARVELDSAGSLVVRCGEVDHVFWDSDKGYLQRAAELINAAHDMAVREAVDERDARIAELERALDIVKETLEKRFADRTKWFEVTGDDGPVWAFDWTNRPTDHDHPAEIPEQALAEIKSVLGKKEAKP